MAQRTSRTRRQATGARPFGKILVANRGEIAVRIIRACREMDIATVAVYSDVDREALHVRFADEAYPVGPAAPRESYLHVERLLQAASQSGAEAVHPGYGFLAENPTFARACAEAGLVFIGPPPGALEALGDKVRARALMIDAGVPVVPGTPPLAGDAGAVAAAAEEIGFPVLIKAAAGGGGRGMRVVRDASRVRSSLDQARGEAASAFGDDRVFLEKFIERPRHIEVQVLADGHGGCIHLGERECSIQRRHQKLFEESPSPVVDPKTRDKLGRLAIRAAKAAGYRSAGTVEFLRDGNGAFYFMEVNARLQVEHPVTEMVTGVDLVKAMIEIAAGNPLPLKQSDIVLRGHSLECRIIAEDPTRNFMPAPGTIRGLRTPGGPGVRYDDGIYAGFAVPVQYDPILAKLITWGRDRIEATRRMRRALDELHIDGVTTSTGFHRRLMDHPAFIDADLHTSFVDDHPELLARDGETLPESVAAIAAAVAHLRKVEARAARNAVARRSGAPSAWRRSSAPGWRRR